MAGQDSLSDLGDDLATADYLALVKRSWSRVGRGVASPREAFTLLEHDEHQLPSGECAIPGSDRGRRLRSTMKSIGSGSGLMDLVAAMFLTTRVQGVNDGQGA